MFRLLRLLGPFRMQVGAVLVLAFAQSLANLYLPRLMADIVDFGIVPGDTRHIFLVGGLMLLVAALGTVCAVAGSYMSARLATTFGRVVRARLFARATRLSIHQFHHFSTASLITRTTNDTTQVQAVVLMMLGMVIAAPMMAIGGVVLAFSQDAALARVLLAVIPVLAVVFFLIMRRAVPLFQAMQEKIDSLNLVLDEGLTGVRVIRAFDRTAHEDRRFDAVNQDVTRTAIAVNRLVALLMPSMFLAMNLTSVAILWFGAQRIDAGQMQVGVMMSSLQYAIQILFAVFMVTALFVMLPRASASAARINAVLETEPEVSDPATPTVASDVTGLVEFRQVSFQYPGAQEAALSDVSFVARPGEITAIIGGTGSGKSTLAGLIPRFYDVNAGQVLVNGVDVRSQTLASLRSSIAYLPQKAVLFSGSIRSNVTFGRSDASDDEVGQAIAAAQASEFVGRMAEGVSAPVAQGGTNLSGGQRQRLAIARALARQSPIYVFDDSFSALDFATEARLRTALRDELRHATVILVSQRIGTVRYADQIIVLDEGRMVGRGRHDALIDECPVYRQIAESESATEGAA